MHLLIDRVLLQDHHNILVVSVGFRRRSLPLVWKALDHRGKSNWGDQQRLLTQALTLLPEGVRITIHGDSEFRSQELFDAAEPAKEWLKRALESRIKKIA